MREFVWSVVGMILTGEQWSFSSKSCSTVTVYTPVGTVEADCVLSTGNLRLYISLVIGSWRHVFGRTMTDVDDLSHFFQFIVRTWTWQLIDCYLIAPLLADAMLIPALWLQWQRVSNTVSVLQYRMSVFSCRRARQLSRNVPMGTGFLCDKASILGDRIKGTL